MPTFASFGKAAWLHITTYNLHKFSFVMVHNQAVRVKKKIVIRIQADRKINVGQSAVNSTNYISLIMMEGVLHLTQNFFLT